MARIRCIKPEFWCDEKLAECSLGARLLFIGTWNFADDDGRMEYSGKRLKMQVFPGDNLDVAPLVEELAKLKLVSVYRVAEREYLAIPNFRKHQRIDHPKPSCIPAPPVADSRNEAGTIQEESQNDPRTLAPEGNGIEGKGMEETETRIPSERKICSDSVSSSPRRKRAIKTAFPDDFGISVAVRHWAEKNNYGRLEEHLEHFIGYAKANGRTYADWDQAFQNAVRQDWAKLSGNLHGIGNVANLRLFEVKSLNVDPSELYYALPPNLDRHAGEGLWRCAVGELETLINRHSFETWIRPCKAAGVRDRNLYVKVPTPDFLHIGEKYSSDLAAVLPGWGVYLVAPSAPHTSSSLNASLN